MKAIIAAAGTGGHINPGIAIANKIKQQEKGSIIEFVGTNDGLENDLVPRAGYKLNIIEAYGFNRKINLRNLIHIIKTFKNEKKARKVLEKFKPDIVIGTGGYICVPVFLAAKKLKIPTVLHESNSYPGVAVKFLSKNVSEILVGFEDTKKRLSKLKNVVVTGTPTKIRNLDMTEEQKNKIKKSLGLSTELPVVLAFGGSQGAQSINETLINIIKENLNKNYQIMWAAGAKQYDSIKENLAESRINIDFVKNIKIVPYIYNMEEIMNMCDVVVARSGAMTITEISKVGKPAIFIPLPNATENHQEYNAKVLVNKGAAKMILDNELSAQNLSNEIESIIKDKQNMLEMGQNARKVEVKNTEDKIYIEISKLVKQK